MPSPWIVALDNVGVVIPSCRFFFYLTGSTTKSDVYTDAALTVPHSNPLTVDSAGRAVVYLGPRAYKVVMAPAGSDDPPASPLKSVDPVNAVPATNVDLDVSGTVGAGANIQIGYPVYLVGSEWFVADNTDAAKSIGPQLIGMALGAVIGAGGNVIPLRLYGKFTGLSGLVAGTTYYVGTAGTITATKPANARIVGVADSTTSLIMAEKREDDVKRVSSFATTVGNVGAGEDILATYVCGVAELTEDGTGWKVHFWGTTANNVNAKTLRVRMNDGTNNTAPVAFALTASELGFWDLQLEVKRFSSTQYISSSVTMVGPAGGPVSRTGVTAFGPAAPATFQVGVGFVAEIRLTGEATTTNDIVVMGGTVFRVG